MFGVVIKLHITTKYCFSGIFYNVQPGTTAEENQMKLCKKMIVILQPQQNLKQHQRAGDVQENVDPVIPEHRIAPEFLLDPKNAVNEWIILLGRAVEGEIQLAQELVGGPEDTGNT